MPYRGSLWSANFDYLWRDNWLRQLAQVQRCENILRHHCGTLYGASFTSATFDWVGARFDHSVLVAQVQVNLEFILSKSKTLWKPGKRKLWPKLKAPTLTSSEAQLWLAYIYMNLGATLLYIYMYMYMAPLQVAEELDLFWISESVQDELKSSRTNSLTMVSLWKAYKYPMCVLTIVTHSWHML